MTAAPAVILGASCAIWHEGRVLLILRKNPPRVWSFPGGRVEPGESVSEAARREVEEETGLSIGDQHFVGLIEAIDLETDPPYHFVVAVHTTERFTGVPEAREDAQACRWVHPDEIGAYETTARLPDWIARSAAVLAGAATG